MQVSSHFNSTFGAIWTKLVLLRPASIQQEEQLTTDIIIASICVEITTAKDEEFYQCIVIDGSIHNTQQGLQGVTLWVHQTQK